MQQLLDQLVNFGFFQSLLLLFIYIFSPSKRKHINGYMALLILLLFLGLGGKVIYNTGLWNYNFRLIALSELSALLFGPTVYLFSRSTLERRTYSTSDLTHYVPAIIYCVFILFYFVIPSNTVATQRAASGELMKAIYACHIVGLTVNWIYFGMSLTVFRNFKKKAESELSYALRSKFIWVLYGILGIALFLWTIVLTISIVEWTTLEREVRPYFWIVLTLLILCITYYGMVNPAVLQIAPKALSKKYANSRLSSSDLERLKKQLDEVMVEKKPYLNNKLLKSELAELMELSNPDLARVLNESMGMNFFEYVNFFRIREFIELAKSDKAGQLTFYGLAQEAGFNSKTTFNKSFKNFMGTSPSLYFKNNPSL